MKSHRILYLFAACLLLLASCKEELDMSLVQKTLYEGADFDEVTVDDAWQVTILQSNGKTGVTLEYSAFLEPYLRARQEGTKFELGFTRLLNLPSNTVMNATLYVPSLKKLSLNDASRVTLEGDFEAPSIEVTLDDAAMLRGGRLAGDLHLELDNASTVVDLVAEGDQLTLSLDNASVFKGQLFARTLLGIVEDNASRMTLYEGDTPKADIRLRSVSFLNMVPVRAEEVEVDLGDASEASVTAVQRLAGPVNDASKLFYGGSPALFVECDETSSCRPL